MNGLHRLGMEKNAYEINVKFLKNLGAEWQQLAMNVQLSQHLGKIGLHNLFGMMIQHEETIPSLKKNKTDPLALLTLAQGGSNVLNAPVHYNQGPEGFTPMEMIADESNDEMKIVEGMSNFKNVEDSMVDINGIGFSKGISQGYNPQMRNGSGYDYHGSNMSGYHQHDGYQYNTNHQGGGIQMQGGNQFDRSEQYGVGFTNHSRRQLVQRQQDDDGNRNMVPEKTTVDPNGKDGWATTCFVWVPVLCEARQTLLDEAHKSKFSIHPDATKMYRDLKTDYWWPGMKRDIAKYVEKCLTCLRVKGEHQRPHGKLQPLEIPEWKWEHVTMDLVTRLPRTPRKHDAIWFHEELGTKMQFNTTFHLQMDGQSERTILNLENMLRACVLDFGGSLESHLPLVEFSYNNSFHASIGMPPYEMLYGRRCKTPICWGEVGQRELGSTEIMQKMTNSIQLIRDRLKTAQSRQKSYADNRWSDLEFNVGDKVLLKVSPWKEVILFRKRDKLCPRFIGPFEIVARVEKLRKCLVDESAHVPIDDIQVDERLNYAKKPIAILERKTKTLRNKEIEIVKVRWENRKGSEWTWEPEVEMRRNYPELFQA
ncbi:hypothetical protein OSB04_023645 [Centaurea solstitialis]|uniref:Integrase zinc-binding domain-containing protein n=1 Tax=Centaurea solstitialis TaxID=347529 RepID=A0AA38T483_9ASTR|nr:hypothetical protein OSB04_023645 [Centaurea solstitialis]